MITQSKIGLNSRSEANPFNEDGFLPLITAPMYSVVDESNYQLFLDNKVQVCLPRLEEKVFDNKYFTSVSLDYFRATFVDNDFHLFREHPESIKICIDTANGNMPLLHSSIKEAKAKCGTSLIIMAGNVGSVEAFVELAKTGCDYIRVGIGGGGGCNTTSNTGVGQENLFNLIKDCSNIINTIRRHYDDFDFSYGAQFSRIKFPKYTIDLTKEDIDPIAKVKIVADGISSWVKHCELNGFNDNGYAAINHLLIAGADLVMVGKLFAQCVESAGEKKWLESVVHTHGFILKEGDIPREYILDQWVHDKENKNPFAQGLALKDGRLQVKYSGMSTQQEQKKYKPLELTVTQDEVFGYKTANKQPIKPSEGSVQWIPVRWSLDEWLNGSDKQDESPYLMGFVNALRSMMAYTNKTKL